MFSCSETTLYTPLNQEEQEAQQYIDEAEAAVAAAEAEIKSFEQGWVGSRSTVVVPAGSVDALAEAGEGGTAVLASGEHTETGNITILQRVKIEGEAGSTLLFSNAPPPMGIPLDVIPSIHILNADQVWLQGFSIRTGAAGAGRIAILVSFGARYPPGRSIPIKAAEPSSNWRAYNNTASDAIFNYLIIGGSLVDTAEDPCF